MKLYGIAVICCWIWSCALAGQSTVSSTSTPSGPPERKQGYFLSLHDHVVEQYRRIRTAQKSGKLNRDQALALRLKLGDFINQAHRDVKKGESEPSEGVKATRYSQLTSIAQEINDTIEKSNNANPQPTPAGK